MRRFARLPLLASAPLVQFTAIQGEGAGERTGRRSIDRLTR